MVAQSDTQMAVLSAVQSAALSVSSLVRMSVVAMAAQSAEEMAVQLELHLVVTRVPSKAVRLAGPRDILMADC